MERVSQKGVGYKDQPSRRVKLRRNYCIFGNISERNSGKMVGLKSDYSGRRR